MTRAPQVPRPKEACSVTKRATKVKWSSRRHFVARGGWSERQPWKESAHGGSTCAHQERARSLTGRSGWTRPSGHRQHNGGQNNLPFISGRQPPSQLAPTSSAAKFHGSLLGLASGDLRPEYTGIQSPLSLRLGFTPGPGVLGKERG